MPKHEDYMDTVKRIEPDVHPLDLGGAAASIAISQKRIADALERIADAFTLPGPSKTQMNVADLFEDFVRRSLDKQR